MEVLYEDNHIIVVNKAAGELVQADPTGDYPLVEMVRDYIRETCHKPGNVFVGSPHRLDRPTWGLVVMTRTTKGLVRMTELFRERRIHKTYWAIVCNRPPHDEGELTHYLVNMKPNNKTYAYPTPRPSAAKAVLRYRLLASGERYHLLEVDLLTGRKHQIRTQLAVTGCPIKGDLKYGAPRSNGDGSISLQAHRIQFEHPVSHKFIDITAPLPPDPLWHTLAEIARQNGLTNEPNEPQLAL